MISERMRLLEEIPGWTWKEPDIWEENRQEWIGFYKKNNKYPSKASENIKEKQLGMWQSQQRINYKKKEKCMTSERIGLLEEIPEWRWKSDIWEENRQEWIEFYRENKKSPSSKSKDKKEKQLGMWQGTQRTNYKKKEKCMTSERIRLLEEIPEWRWKEPDIWEENRQEWIEFYKNNEKSPIEGSKNIKEKNLGKWQSHQRNDYTKKEIRMTSERIRLLEEETPGWRWKEPDTWEENRQEWIEFYRENKRSPSQTSKDKKEKQLGIWQSDQRKNYKKKEKCMTLERIRLLEETVGWSWGISKTSKEPSEYHQIANGGASIPPLVLSVVVPEYAL